MFGNHSFVLQTLNSWRSCSPNFLFFFFFFSIKSFLLDIHGPGFLLAIQSKRFRKWHGPIWAQIGLNSTSVGGKWRRFQEKEGRKEGRKEREYTQPQLSPLTLARFATGLYTYTLKWGSGPQLIVVLSTLHTWRGLSRALITLQRLMFFCPLVYVGAGVLWHSRVYTTCLVYRFTSISWWNGPKDI